MEDALPEVMPSQEEEDDSQRSFATAPEHDDQPAKVQTAADDKVCKDLEAATKDHDASDDQAVLDDEMALGDEDEPVGDDQMADDDSSLNLSSRTARWLKASDAELQRMGFRNERDYLAQCLDTCRNRREALDGFLPFGLPSRTSTSRAQHERPRAASCPGTTHLV